MNQPATPATNGTYHLTHTYLTPSGAYREFSRLIEAPSFAEALLEFAKALGKAGLPPNEVQYIRCYFTPGALGDA